MEGTFWKIETVWVGRICGFLKVILSRYFELDVIVFLHVVKPNSSWESDYTKQRWKPMHMQ